MKIRLLGLTLFLAGASTLPASADEGLGVLSNISTQADRLSASAKTKPTKQQTYKTVDETEQESSSSADYFRGSPLLYDHNLFAGIGLDFFSNLGINGRYAYRVLKEGFIPDVNDAFYIEGGVALTFYGKKQDKTTTGFDFSATARWDFQMSKEFIFFGAAGFGLNSINGADQDVVKGGGFHVCVGGGAMYNFAEDLAVRADVSYQFLGVGILKRF